MSADYPFGNFKLSFGQPVLKTTIHTRDEYQKSTNAVSMY